MKRHLSLFFSPRGRIGRGPFWWAYGAQSVSLLAFLAIAVFVIDRSEDDPSLGIWMIEAGLLALYLVFAFASMILGIKRFHDCGKSGWWTLMSFVPFVGSVWYLREIGCARGESGDNRYGVDPQGGRAADSRSV